MKAFFTVDAETRETLGGVGFHQTCIQLEKSEVCNIEMATPHTEEVHCSSSVDINQNMGFIMRQ